MASETSMTYVCDVIENEGFDYGLRSYSSFNKVKDKKFQELLKKYNEVADELEDYIDSFRGKEE